MSIIVYHINKASILFKAATLSFYTNNLWVRTGRNKHDMSKIQRPQKSLLVTGEPAENVDVPRGKFSKPGDNHAPYPPVAAGIIFSFTLQDLESSTQPRVQNLPGEGQRRP